MESDDNKDFFCIFVVQCAWQYNLMEKNFLFFISSVRWKLLDVVVKTAIYCQNKSESVAVRTCTVCGVVGNFLFFCAPNFLNF